MTTIGILALLGAVWYLGRTGLELNRQHNISRRK